MYLKEIQKKTWLEYESVLLQEEMLWMQKSRCQWIINGDRNTRFFHTTTMIRRKRNKIETLKREDGEWAYDVQALKEMAIDFFCQPV